MKDSNMVMRVEDVSPLIFRVAMMRVFILEMGRFDGGDVSFFFGRRNYPVSRAFPLE
jgi:hypothetical protein